MASKTQYYYLKIKENFFDTEDMKLLESMDNGYLYSNILMKMYLLSLKNGGKLMYKDKIPYNSKMLSTILNHNVDILDKAIQIFRELNLIEIMDSGAIFMLDIQNYIGKSSDEADRKREYRKLIDNEKQNLIEDKCPTDVMTNCSNIKDIDITKDIIIDNSYSIDNIYDFIEKNFGRTLSPIEYEEISTWEDNELTRYAIKQSVLNGKYNIRYIAVILNNYKNNSITTVQQAQEQEEIFKKHKTRYTNPRVIEKIPDWVGKDIQEEYLSDEEVEIFEKMLNSEIDKDEYEKLKAQLNDGK